MGYMNTDATWETEANSIEQTEQLAAALGSKLRGGEVIELVADLGGGKTTFTRGLVRGAGSTDRVASPTFTISREYTAPKFTIAHFDFYRLSEAGIVGDELGELIGDSQYVTIIEWGEIVHDVLPQQRLTITLTQTGDATRSIIYTYPPDLAYLLEEAK
jgi:tRNA threonylcarbamoyladenosine biosynthesis protein TsaE